MRLFDQLDWKFFVSLVATVAGIVIPVWLWQIDQTSKAMSATLVDSSLLTPNSTQPLSGLALTFNGAPVNKAFWSTVEIMNDGFKPLIANEWEAPIEISTSSPSRILSAKLVSVSPSDLRPSMLLADNRIQIVPLLLNPNDKIRIGILTVDGSPEFQVRTRIAGVSNTKIEDKSDPARAHTSKTRITVLAFFLMIIYCASAILAGSRHFRLLDRVAFGMASVVCSASSTKLLTSRGMPTDFYSALVNISPLLLLAILSTFGLFYFRSHIINRLRFKNRLTSSK